MAHWFLLEDFKGIPIHTCPNCKKDRVFRRFIYADTGQHIGNEVGVCSKRGCGYQYGPLAYFRDNKIVPRFKGHFQGPSFIPEGTLLKSLKQYENNLFVRYLDKKLGSESSQKLVTRYQIGSSKRWEGASILWYIDSENRVRTGKIILINSDSGKLISQCLPFVTWVHDRLKIERFNAVPCLFGEHLLSKEIGKTVVVMQNERNAILGSHFYPELVWVATGFTSPTETMCKALSGRNVIWYPDNGFDKLKSFGTVVDTPFTNEDVFDWKRTDILKLNAA